MSEFAPPPYTCIYAYIIKVGQDQKVSCKKSGAKLETQILTFSFGGARLDNPPQRLQIFIDSYNFLALYWAWLGPKILTFFSIVRCCLRVYTCIYAYIIKVGQDQKVSCKKSGAKLETQILTFSFGGARLDNPPQRLQIFIDSYNFLALYWAWLGPKILTFFSIVRCCLRVDPRVSDIAPPV